MKQIKNLGKSIITKENTNATKLKRERENARLAAMTQEERNEKNRKCRERYHQKKAVKSDFVFLNSVLPFLVYLIYSNVMWYQLELIRPRKTRKKWILEISFCQYKTLS